MQEGVKARQIGDRPADSESVSSSLSPFPQRLEDLICLFPFFPAVHLHVEALLLSSPCHGILDLRLVPEDRSRSSPVPDRLDVPVHAMPITWPQPGEELMFEGGRRPGHDERKGWKSPVVGEHLHDHVQVWDKGDWFERLESPRILLLCMRGSKLSPDPLGPILRIDHAAHPLILRATRPGLHEAQGVLKRAADAREIANPGEKAILDVVDAARERREVFSEHLSHQPRIASDLELREAGIRREGLKVHYLSSEVDDTVAQAPLQPSHALTEPAYPAHPVRLVPNVREAP